MSTNKTSKKMSWDKTKKAGSQMRFNHLEADTVSWMIGRAGKIPLVSYDESVDLFKLLESGDKTARSKIIRSNMRLVISIAKRFRKSGLDFEDLMQEGNIGLMKAIEKFDYKRGYRFSTYATWWIRQAVGQFVAKASRTVRLPAHAIGVSRKIDEIKREFKEKFGEEPSDEDISEMIDVSESIVKASARGARRIVSLSSPIDRDAESGDTLGDTIPDTREGSDPFEILSARETFELIKESFAKLTPKEEQIMRLRFGIAEASEMQISDEEELAIIAKKTSP